MKTRLLALLIVVTILFGVAACDTKEPTATNPPPPTNTEVAAVPTNTATATTVPPTATATATAAPPTETATAKPSATEEPSPTPEPTEPPESADQESAAFEDAPCPFDLPVGQTEGQTVTCGYLSVPENRADPDSGTIRLAVARFSPEGGPTEPEPIIYLQGGPGASSLEFMFLSFEQYAPLLDTGRDLIFFDQRGIGLSEPSLDCPEFLALSLDLLDNELDGETVTLEEATDALQAELLACEEDLSGSADLTAYNSVESAADVDSLRQALGYERVNLWGTSYGTRLALETMRQHPDGIRSVILDSVYPPDADIYMEGPANLDRALNTLFDACAADQACNEAYPDLSATLFDTIDRLREEPAPLELRNPLTGETYDAMLDGDTLQALVFQLLYKTQIIPSLPQLIYEASEGDYHLLALIWGSLLAEAPVSSRGMMFSVQCNEEVPFSTADEFEAMLADFPEIAGMYQESVVGKLTYEVCDGWDSGTADSSQNEPVASNIPAVVLAGEFDPITPPAWARQAAGSLENSFYFEFPGYGHGASIEPCGQEIVMDFLDDPATAPDDACIAGLGATFAVPGEAGEAVELEEFTSEALGVTGLVPVGWEEVSPGVFGRGASALDQTVLLQQGAPLSADQLLDLLLGQFGLEEAPEPVGQREANGLTWNLYSFEVQGIPVDLAIAEADGLSLIVLLQGDENEREALYDTVFLPAVDALVPAG